jgi:hypothetical protein
VTEAAVSATPLLKTGRVYAEVKDRITAGIAIANPSNQTATVNFHLTNSSGVDAVTSNISISANKQIAKFLTESPFNSGTLFLGAFTFTSDVPVAVVALRGYVNERNELLWTTLPVTDLSATPATDTVYLPHFADGSGWTTQIVLVNPTDSEIAGKVQFFSPGSDTLPGSPIAVTINGQVSTIFSYTIPRQSSFQLATSGIEPPGVVLSGSLRVVATAGTAPSSLVIFSLKNSSGITVSEAGVAGIQASAFRMYVEETMAVGAFPAIQSGFAIANLAEAAVTVRLDLTSLDGSAAGSTTIRIPGNGQIAKMLHDVFPNVALPIQGVLRVTGGSAEGMSAAGLRLRYNERGDVLTTTTPPTNEDSPTSSTELFFPQLVDGGGWTTQFILFGGQGEASSGEIRFNKNDGSAFNVVLQ